MGRLPTLVIVDMQPHFVASNKQLTLAGCEGLIRLAMERGFAIVVVEFKNSGPTNSRLTDLLEGYDRKITVYKSAPGGGKEVEEGCHCGDFATHHFIVCGVNIHACVKDTVTDLTMLFPESQVDVVKSACNDSIPADWNDFPASQYVNLVPCQTLTRRFVEMAEDVIWQGEQLLELLDKPAATADSARREMRSAELHQDLSHQPRGQSRRQQRWDSRTRHQNVVEAASNLDVVERTDSWCGERGPMRRQFVTALEGLRDSLRLQARASAGAAQFNIWLALAANQDDAVAVLMGDRIDNYLGEEPALPPVEHKRLQRLLGRLREMCS